MQTQTERRVHSAQLKAAVLAECQEPGAAAPERRSSGDIDIELQRGNARLTVRWPGGQAGACAAWLSELAAQVLE